MGRRAGLLWLFIACSVSSADAVMKLGDSVLFVNVGYSNGKSAVSGDNIDGAFVLLDFQKMDWAKPISAGVSAAYGEIQQSVTEDSSRSDYTISTLPILLGGKYWFGKKNLQAYLGLAFGIYFSHLEGTFSRDVGRLAIGGEFSSETGVGFGLGVPVGVTLSAGETVMLNLSYVLNWLWDSEYLDGDLMHAVGVGLGLRFGATGN
jgi:hypothetical protein